MTKLFKRKLVKFTVYALIVFIAYILQSTPGLFDFFGISPIFVLPCCICIAVFDGEFSGGLFGFVMGLFCDSAGETVFGFNALIFLLLCTASGLAAIYVFRRSTINIMLLCLAAVFIRSGLEFFFGFFLYDYENLREFFYTVIAPQVVYTSVFIYPTCELFRFLHRKFEPEETKE